MVLVPAGDVEKCEGGGGEAADVIEQALLEEEKYANRPAQWDDCQHHRLANTAFKITELP
jgi:hypothetical protein